MKYRLKLWVIFLSVLLQASITAKGQEDYRFDAGGGLGITGYLGDANSSFLWNHPSWDAEVFLRYIANPRWAFKTNLYAGSLSGNSADMANVFPDDKTYKFSTFFCELGEVAEFSFFNYGMGESYRKLKRFTPYIAAGAGVTAWNTGGSSHLAFTLPVGFGVKYKPSLRVNLGLEFLMKKTFSDRLDGASLNDPLGIKSSFIKNTDWYSTLTFSISYEFSKRCAVCNYKD